MLPPRVEHHSSPVDPSPSGAPSSATRPGGPPTCNTGVGIERVFENQGQIPYGWDWSSTTHDGREGIVGDLLQALGAKVILPAKGLQGWSQSVKGFDSEGHALGAVYFGGGRDDVHVVSTSTAADRGRAAVVKMDRARTSRVDTRVDTLVPYEDLVQILRGAASTYGSRITRIESEEQGKSLGRTVYLGAPSSAVRVRVYEKWLESPGQYVEGTNRVEVQLRPASKVKERVSSWSPAQTFCASRVTQDLALSLGDDLAPKSSLYVKRPTPTLEETMESMGRQYGKAFRTFMDFSGGDIGKVLQHLGAA